MIRSGITGILLTCLTAMQASGQQSIKSVSSGFIENKGQVVDQNNKPNPAVLYLLNTPGMNVQIRSNGFSYDVYSPHPVDMPVMRTIHRIDFDLAGCNPGREIVAAGKTSGYLNYYTTGTPEEGVNFVHSYQSVTFRNIYRGIDLEFLTDTASGFKYNFIVHPGGDLSAIRIKIKGPAIELSDKGNLLLITPVGTIEERIPESYYSVDGQRSVIHAVFTRTGPNVFGFKTCGLFPGASTLVIDPVPNRLWATYYGGMNVNPSSTEEINSLKIDNEGNLILVGQTPSPDNIATAGSFQSTFAGESDAFVTKFNPDGVRLWGTYYGGSEDDRGKGCAVNAQGDIFMTGETFSTSQIATPGTYQTLPGGYEDSFVARFYPNGIRKWGTYYGGSETEFNYGCTLDRDGNLYTCGVTYSGNNISTPGAYQVGAAGNGDAFLGKFSSDGQIVWGTYYGGNLAENGLGVCADTLNNIILVGNTKSHGGIATPGAHQENYGGNGPNSSGDGFIARFNTGGQLQWGTYYGGSDGDNTDGCVCSNSGMIYVTGDTGSPDNISTPGSFQPVKDVGTDAFFSKFNMAGIRMWGTYYGGNLEDHGWACDYDPRGRIFFCGYTASTVNISTPAAFQPFNNGYWDVFLARFDTNGSRVWCTYYGAYWADYGWTLAVDTNDRQYVGGQTQSTTNMASQVAHQTVFGGPHSDGFMVKFTDCVNPHSGPISGQANVCKNSTETYSIPPIYKVYTYNWEVPPGASIIAGQNSPSITVSYSDTAISGNITVYATDHCGIGDTATLLITVHSNPLPVISGSSAVCRNTLSTYTTQGGKSNYLWTCSPGGSIMTGGSISDSTAGLSWSTTGQHYVSVTFDNANGCPVPPAAIMPVTVGAGPLLTNMPLSENLCSGDSTRILLTTNQPGTTYTWTASGSSPDVTGFSGGSGEYINQELINTGTASATVTYTITTHFDGCDGLPVDYVVTVIPLSPVGVSIAASQNPVCSGTSVTFTATPVYGGTIPAYQWKVNGISTGTNSPFFVFSPVNGDVVTCLLLSSESCTSVNPVQSNPVTMVVNAHLPAGITIAASDNPFCPGSPVTFTATPYNGGSNPSYQWKVNGINAGTNSTLFIYNPVNGDVVSCVVTSSDPCTTGNPATSLPLTMIVNTSLPAGITIAASANPFCPGSSVTFTATPYNGGSNPSYQWTVNGINAGANASVFSYNPSDNDSVWCVITSNLSCVSGNPASSAKITMIGTLAPQVAFTACFDTVTNINAKPFKLKGGLPFGGTYTGPGVNSSTGYFTPSIAGTGVKIVSYSYVNVYDCSAGKSTSILVQPAPGFTCGSNLTDTRDNKVYSTVQIGTQCWMAANLNYGNIVLSSSIQDDNCIPERYCYNNLTANCNRYGGLYQWDELMNYTDTPAGQGLCPPGWHVPSESDWMILFNYYQGNSRAGKPLQDSVINGFRATHSGVFYLQHSMNYEGFATLLWSSASSGLSRALAHGMNDWNYSVSLYPALKANAFPARCLLD